MCTKLYTNFYFFGGYVGGQSNELSVVKKKGGGGVRLGRRRKALRGIVVILASFCILLYSIHMGRAEARGWFCT